MGETCGWYWKWKYSLDLNFIDKTCEIYLFIFVIFVLYSIVALKRIDKLYGHKTVI